MTLGLAATLAVSDPLSRGRYDGDFFEKFYGEARTGLGRVEIGLTDGGGYDVAVTGPKVDAQVSLDDPQTTFFRDPATHHAVTDMFALRTEVGASSNYAKFAYLSPALFGLQLALSFTPSQSREAVPFLNQGRIGAGSPKPTCGKRACVIPTNFGPVTLTGYGGLVEGEGEHKLPGQEGVSDLGAGVRVDYAVNDDLALSLGGSYRQSNAYAFDISHSQQSGTTHALLCFGASATYDQWVAGLEYGNGNRGRGCRPAATGPQRLSGLIGLCAEQELADHRRLAAIGLCALHRPVLQWRAASGHGCGFPASQSSRLRHFLCRGSGRKTATHFSWNRSTRQSRRSRRSLSAKAHCAR